MPTESELISLLQKSIKSALKNSRDLNDKNPGSANPENLVNHKNPSNPDYSEIKFKNFENFATDKDRFLFGFTKNGFLKITKSNLAKASATKNLERLERESNAIEVALKSNIITLPLICPYHKTDEDFAYIYRQAFDRKENLQLANNIEIAEANPILATKAAYAIYQLSEKPIPPDINTKPLEKYVLDQDVNNHSTSEFYEKWLYNKKLILDNPENLPANISVSNLENLIDSTWKNLEPILQKHEGDDENSQSQNKKYFVHNDLTPNNIYYSNDKAFVFDLELAGVTKNRILALISDLGTYYARSWVNKNQEFRLACLLEIYKIIKNKISNKNDSNSTKDNKDYIEETISLSEIKIILESTIVFTSLNLAKFGIDKNHSEHNMYLTLLGNLENDLEVLRGKFI